MGEEDEERIRNGTGQGRRCDVTAASGLRLTTVPLCFFTLPRSSVRYLDYLQWRDLRMPMGIRAEGTFCNFWKLAVSSR